MMMMICRGGYDKLLFPEEAARFVGEGGGGELLPEEDEYERRFPTTFGCFFLKELHGRARDAEEVSGCGGVEI
ncbi:hypothetical protein E3N88_14751 [Mikania micrantha]|uniref:Uncharacterized protein n=1 Tax=Mikania micrantha TaxID=192012 RepID=A0A5N6P418_9ASTR|nr:hypothetical protein E3N88_14751 [Mikania micrantha]